MNGPKVCSRGMSQRHTMCGNIRYKHYESNEKDTTDNSNKDTTEGSDVTETTTVTITDTTTDETLTTNVNEEPISTTSNPHQNSNGMYILHHSQIQTKFEKKRIFFLKILSRFASDLARISGDPPRRVSKGLLGFSGQHFWFKR